MWVPARVRPRVYVCVCVCNVVCAFVHPSLTHTLPQHSTLLGPYLVFISSTINGYEGTGRSLSLKLLNQLRKQQSTAAQAAVSE